MEASELIERLEKATGPDRDLDAALYVALCKPKQYPDDLRYYYLPSVSTDHMEMCAPGTYWLKERSGRSLQTAPAYTASLDAALALVERVLPGWGYFLRHDSDSGYVAALVYPDAFRVTPGATNGANMATALCLALLRASPTEEPALPPQAQAASDLQPQE